MPESATKNPAPGGSLRSEPVLERRTLRDYYVIIREHIWLAISISVLVSVSLGYYLARQTPVYATTATLQFQRPEKVVTSEAVTDNSVRGDADINTYLQILGSAKLRARIAESFTPVEVAVLQKPYLASLQPGVIPPSAGMLINDMSIEAVRNSFLVTVTARAQSAESAALIANRFVEEFIDFLIERGSGGNEAAIDSLTRRASEMKLEYEKAERELQAYKERENLVSLEDTQNIVIDRLKSLNGALTNARIQRLDLEGYRAQVDAFRKDDRNLLEITFIAQYGSIPGLRAQIDELVRREAILNERYLERHPKMIETANALTSLRAQLDVAMKLAVSDLDSRLEKARENEVSLTGELANAESEAFRLGKLSVEFKSLENQTAVNRQNYISILDRLNQINTTKNLENIPVRPLDRAAVPNAPVSPNLTRILRNCIFLGLVLFFGVPIALNFIDDRVKSSWDIEAFIGANLLGIIPDLGSVKPEERPTLVTKQETTPAVEAFLSAYSAVKLASKLDFPKSLMVTSTIPGEGKTLVSCNIAASFARHGKSTVLVDCDLRRPMIHRHFGVENDHGLSPWAEGGYFIADDPLTDQNLGILKIAPNLHLIRAGGRSKTPTHIFENPAFGDLIESLKRRFDLVVVDTPPIGAVTDGLLIAERTDEAVYVCRFNKAQRKHIRIYIKSLRESKNDLLGIVLNGMNPRRIEHYSDYRYYRSYKKYYGAQS
jgi:succinoglycan biosynthesis transport protein ExoP